MYNLFTYTGAVSFVPKRIIGQFTATVTIEEVARDELKITQHPVQEGSTITDHACMQPAKLELKIAWDASLQPLTEMYQNLLDLQSSRVPFDVVTGKRSYKNMLFSSLGQLTDAQTENILAISASLQEIFIVPVTTATVPRSNQKNPAKTGKIEKAGTKNAGTITPQEQSFYKNLFASGGLL